MSKKYYDHIGKDMIKSWLKYWPQDSSLIIYSEDNLGLENFRLKLFSLSDMDQAYHDFQKNTEKKLNERSNTFAKKAWPIMKHLEANNGKLIWLDADVITESIITYDWLDSLISSNQFSCHMGVPQNEFYSIETGFFIINLENNYKNIFLDKYRSIYYHRDFTNMKKPFDGDVFGRIITEMRSINGFTYNDLSFDLKKLSPFNTIFKGKMRHFKGKQKIRFKEVKNAT